MLEILIKKGETNLNLDLFDDESVNLNFSINSIKDISNTTGSFTKTIILPNTPKNRRIFGYITDLSSDTLYNYENLNDYNPNKKVKCSILEDSLTVMDGYIQLNRFSIIHNESENLEATIYGDNTSFFIAMGDTLLTDIDFSEYNFKWTRDVISNTWNNDSNSYERGYYFPLIDYGKGWIYNDLSDLSKYSLDVKDFLPAVFVKSIWDKIFKSNGFNYKSNFLGTSVLGLEPTYANPRFGNLIIPFNKQVFSNPSMITSDKAFFLGITFSNSLSQFTTYSTGWYLSKYSSLTLGPKLIPNANASLEFTDRYNWYNGYLLNPFESDPNRNTAGNTFYSDWKYATFSLSLGQTASPFYNGSNGSEEVYSIPNRTYKNISSDIYKQKFVLETDIVTTYSIKGILDYDNPDLARTGSASSYGLSYIMKVDFYRSIDQTTGITSSTWDAGYGYKIPADLGTGATSGGYEMCKNVLGVTDSITHWITDINHKSNCFTKSGKLIVPTTSKRYLGDYCTSYKGDKAITPTGQFATFSGPSGSAYWLPTGEISGPTYKYNSGNCVAWYYNDGWTPTGTSSINEGMWVSGRNGQIFDSYYFVGKATHQPTNGDWFQQLQLQTIVLDGDQSNPFYGDGGIYLKNGNNPIAPGEQVRCVITFGSKYPGQAPQSSIYSYKPPTVAYLLSTTNFTDGTYSFTASYPLTRFYNDISTEYITGQTVNFNTLIPDNIKQRDFVQDIVRMHNLYIEPYKDTNKYPNTLVIEPREDYYAISNDVLDWRDKLDTINPLSVQIFGETQYKRTRFTYKEDSDYYNKAYKQDTNEVYGQFIYSLDNQFLTNELKIESQFAPTPLSQLYSKIDDNYVIKEGGIILPVYLSSDGMRQATNGTAPNITTGYRIMLKKYLDIKNGDGIYIFADTSTSNALSLKYPYAGPYDDPYNPSYTLNWGQTIGEFFASPTDRFSNNLVNEYWAPLLSEMGDADSRIIVARMFLNVNDINNFYFYKEVLLTINGVDGYYKVINISGYIPGKNSLCTVTFLKSKKLKNVFKGSSNH